LTRASIHPITRSQIARSDYPIRRKLLAWSRLQKRELPWRKTRDPYRIWVSEVMLQQTTVAAVRGRFERFLARFPDLPALARAREESVLAAWSGLGYYARARNLHRAARMMLREHEGLVPRAPADLRRLPGFGDYTAAAVACLAFGSREPAADANVTRVLSRLFAMRGIAGRKNHRAAVERQARRLLSSGPPERLTAALMDLGQLVCLPRLPLCNVCPLAEDCAARRRGSPEDYPRRGRKPAPVEVFLAAASVRRQERTLLLRRRSRLLDGLWEFPCAEGRSPLAARRRLAEKLSPHGLVLEDRPRGKARHTVVNRRIWIEVFPASPDSRRTIPDSRFPDARWFTRRQLDRAAIPTLTRKVARAAGFL
jgi:A/G-specific adenine glycosylase